MKVTCKGGPLDGKKFIVPRTTTVIIHHAAHGGTYTVKRYTATWKPINADTGAVPPIQHVPGLVENIDE